ncbi:MAG: methionyl aminopeptidase [Planctomycetota bacterium]|jgi:methionyl aminopeptidase
MAPESRVRIRIPSAMVKIRDKEAMDSWRRAGRIASECREWARSEIKPGVRIRHILETVESMIREQGSAPAFPAQSSRNHVAAHYCSPPNDETVYEEGDCVKVDVGVHVNGYVADTATTIDLSVDGRWGPLIKSSSDALAAAIATVGPDVKVSEVGTVVERTITQAGFEPIRNLTGHGVDRWKVHCAPQIPNYPERGTARFHEGMMIAIEPFASTGRGYITENGRSEVFMLVRPPRNAKGLDRDILKEIESWRGLPIARRYFKDFDQVALEEIISKLAKQGSLMRYPPLVEEAGVMTAQTEHSIFIGPDGVEVITA